ncbi:efflux RND transporter periplasmic adaptor subunit [Vibrio tetraodonis]|uniref:efflux RND transporter periplasmic adaptor subunit n=1 Tax=Vibrio tetraodonis TaxID=2231647 RepID=UPI000E0BF266|nr:efflux RND transporter periplasmic adaptor subunit [Vibrio tetraodonis]
MRVKLLRWYLPFVLLAVAYGGYIAISSGNAEALKIEQVEVPLTVKVSHLRSGDHNVVITSHGEVVPVEITQLSAQVSGEVISWHPSFVPGEVVKEGEILFSIESENYNAAVLQAEADLATAQAALIEEKAKAEVAKRQAKNVPSNQVTDLYLRKPQVLSAQAQVKSALASLKRAKRDLDNCRVVAPYDALVVERDIGVGQYITAGTRVAVLNNIESAEIHVPIAGFDSVFLPEDYSGVTAKVTQKGVVNIEREGIIKRDLGVIDSATRMTSLVINVDDPYALTSDMSPLKFGSYVEVNFVGKTLTHIYRLPQELVNNRQVWIVNEDDELEPRTVNVLRAEQEFMLINEGLKDNDRLVLTVPEYPQKGTQVQLSTFNDESKQ